MLPVRTAAADERLPRPAGVRALRWSPCADRAPAVGDRYHKYDTGTIGEPGKPSPQPTIHTPHTPVIRVVPASPHGFLIPYSRTTRGAT